jgi:hypothetical protein
MVPSHLFGPEENEESDETVRSATDGATNDC